MDISKIKTIGELKKSGYISRPIKDEIRANLINKIKAKENPFPGILGYEDSVIPDTERALLSRHNILFLGFGVLVVIGMLILILLSGSFDKNKDLHEYADGEKHLAVS